MRNLASEDTHCAFAIVTGVMPCRGSISAWGDLSMSRTAFTKHLPKILDRSGFAREATSNSNHRDSLHLCLGRCRSGSTGHYVCISDMDVKTRFTGNRKPGWRVLRSVSRSRIDDFYLSRDKPRSWYLPASSPLYAASGG